MSDDVDDLVAHAVHGAAQQLTAEISRAVLPLQEGGDGEKDIGEVYRDRNLLVFALARAVADSHGPHNVGAYEHDEWAVVAVRLPTGVASWHVRPETVPDWIPERDPEEWFDGHTREEKNRRVQNYAERDYSEKRPTGKVRFAVINDGGELTPPAKRRDGDD